ncbi:hypothetical protein SAMN05444158_4441 [Bradyrhizobium canariense]|uniref:Uncharacterized protein n=1 Tax=Bradyrhizobium canariense TaxID=255045 RepID=A0A1H1XQJ9_9BRAD|nr:hypothetical protein SAMN05444158_4441 [Bradyrhizobium canariense]
MKMRPTALSRVTFCHGGNAFDVVWGESIFELHGGKSDR